MSYFFWVLASRSDEVTEAFGRTYEKCHEIQRDAWLPGEFICYQQTHARNPNENSGIDLPFVFFNSDLRIFPQEENAHPGSKAAICCEVVGFHTLILVAKIETVFG